ncbi:OmpH family outer membrane protein [Crocinitomicaceae bacterium CZZ-1]|uniref:OmpH family outer membrane protein n=1 Tax=Taishania pollutisoli TaxID=2766479 RepID=A0A8J6PCN8_9FLAO|nr:OmpH family outer membrane protein [Taishania pollutisoli]MBC9812763.1 OmpH family outer membrane protein [Taishania pollutisoli]NGF76207.1 OmpH family outer membrane protein [Fluviicola sp. SGL-29]
MKKTHYFLIGAVIISTSIAVYSFFATPKIAVVDFKRLVNDYQGMKDATLEYEKKMTGWNTTSDSLTDAIKNELSDYYADSAFLSKQERVNRETKIISMRNKFMEFSKGLEENAMAEDQKMTIEVVNQVLSFVEKYGNDKGYDVILGKNEGDEVLYRKASMDITNELLQALNRNYEGF